tara:strand:- start:3426 stop:3941 length:516 start_codon:yes stop_codon:yes gene_type:complete
MKYIKLYEDSNTEREQEYNNFNKIILDALKMFENKIIKQSNNEYIIEIEGDGDNSFSDDQYEYSVGDPETKKAFYNNEINKSHIILLQYIHIYRKDKMDFGGLIQDDNESTLLQISEINKVLNFLKTLMSKNPNFGTYGLKIENKNIQLMIEYNIKDHFSKIGDTMVRMNK